MPYGQNVALSKVLHYCNLKALTCGPSTHDHILGARLKNHELTCLMYIIPKCYVMFYLRM